MNLFEYPHSPGYRHRETSREAAALVSNVSELHQKIIDALTDSFPMTDYELASYLGEEFRKVQPRRSELTAQEKLSDSGARRKTPYGRNAIVWRINLAN